MDVGHHGQRRSRVFLDDRQIDRVLAVNERVSIRDVDVVLDGRHVAEVDVPLQPERNIAQLLDVAHRRVVGDHRHRVVDVDVPRGDDGVPRRQGIDNVLRRQVVVEELVRVDVDNDRPHVRAERRDRHRAGDVLLHQRPDDIIGQVPHRPQRSDVALEHQVADRDAAGVHPHDHRRQGPLGHPRHRPVRHRHDLGHRLAHVSAGEERELAQGHLLNVPCIDILDAINVLEIQLELIDDEALHLVGAHADEIQEDIDLRDVQRREDIHAHPVEAEKAAADKGHDQHQGRDWAPHGEAGRIHGPHSPYPCWQLRHLTSDGSARIFGLLRCSRLSTMGRNPAKGVRLRIDRQSSEPAPRRCAPAQS